MRPRRKGPESGFTVTEAVVAVGILAVIAIPITNFVAGTFRRTVAVGVEADSQEDLRQALVIMEKDMFEMNQVDEAGDNTLTFRLDSYRLPGYRGGDNFDGDAMLNDVDPDDDGDEFILGDPATETQRGDDLRDDDDDNNGRVDVRCRFRLLDNGDLVRDFSFNEAGFGAPRVLARNVIAKEGKLFRYFGAVSEPGGNLLDTGSNGILGDGEPGDSDGLVTAEEIDRTPPNGNGVNGLDTPQERASITSIAVSMAQDRNQDGKEDGALETEVAPPLLPLKRMR